MEHHGDCRVLAGLVVLETILQQYMLFQRYIPLYKLLTVEPFCQTAAYKE